MNMVTFCTPSLALIVFLIGFALLVPSSNSQNSPQDYLNAHNVARLQVGVANISWDSTVEASAKTYANSRISDCNLVHSDNSYGENLAKGGGSFTGTAAVNLWVAEKPYYNYTTNTCVGGQCLHYTQVVWRNSVRLGCARVQCTNGWWFVKLQL
ncbi:Pathogenesis-related protein 1 [Quillaja saponaria]|uniref:Pathogenesis-related protein 1 n=1 Tax=Quillaja saponaria TaxID=32244 RepID=A0AAD7KXC6_QUISA|nr:Pathogenesis-related protein 1 [Quillaja saponaria]